MSHLACPLVFLEMGRYSQVPAALQMFVPNASVLELFSAGVYFTLALFRSKGSDRLVLFLLTAVWNGEEGMFHQG